jgi:hypothetical protein
MDLGLVPDVESPPQYYHINAGDRISPPGEAEDSARGFRFAFWSYLQQTITGPMWGFTTDQKPSVPPHGDRGARLLRVAHSQQQRGRQHRAQRPDVDWSAKA